MLDGIFTTSLVPLACAILISGLDDLFVDLVWLAAWISAASNRFLARLAHSPGGSRATGAPVPQILPNDADLNASPTKKIAILVPLWHEHAVIRGMLEHNLAAINYPDFHFFAGCYANDAPTIAAVHSVEAHEPRVHLCICPHDGPTSKADCLNWAYQQLLIWEEQNHQLFDIVMMHDAEDLIHPESLRFVNHYVERGFDMVQIPVLALATPLREIVHGLYCDEFAEYQTRDMAVRGFMKAFIPSTGVGTGIRREALDKLAAHDANRLFTPESLTEDYDLGLRLKALQCLPICVPVEKFRESFVATREFFPRHFSAALRQRTRWVTGISLQSWQAHGWHGSPTDIYWLWRDRKGLFGNPIGLFANLISLYGAFHWNLTASISTFARNLLFATLILQCVRFTVRFLCVRRIYGSLFALGIPIRALFGTALNTAATFSALGRFTYANIRRRPLRWLKTEHAYPNRAALARHKRRLGEVLVGSGFVTPQEIDAALLRPADGHRLGEFLVNEGLVTEEQLFEALCLQHGLPPGPHDLESIRHESTRILPAHISDAWRMLAFDVEPGRVRIAVDDIPSEALLAVVRRYVRMEPEFHLLPPSRFEALKAALAT
jgi:adsorption protein B